MIEAIVWGILVGAFVVMAALIYSVCRVAGRCSEAEEELITSENKVMVDE